MSNLEFRAWDKMTNKMRKVISIDLCPEFGGAWFWGKSYHPFDDGEYEADKDFLVWEQMAPLMQSTGLLDKNGKEIWEGDIVEFKFNKDWCEGEYLPKERFEVSLEIFRLWCKGERFGYEAELLLDPSNCLIIGNIYENKDLLNETK